MMANNVFDSIYKNKIWGDGESASGPGSYTSYTTNIRQEILTFVSKFSVSVLFDAPCGDFHWMKQVAFPETMAYIGGDISSAVVQKNQEDFTSDRRKFIDFNITTDAFPKADAWFCRDCLFHLSFEDIYKALNNFVNSDIPILFTTTHPTDPGPFQNMDIVTGGWRMLDLCLPPFELPRDVSFWAADYVYPYPRREMCVWTRQQIAAALPTMVGKGLFATHDVALRKPAKQSSVSRWSRRPTVDQDAAGANSGAVLQAYAFHTDYEVDPWWEVDLLSEFYIEKIIILNSENHPERLLNFSLLKSSDGNNWEVIYQNKGGSGPQGPESTVFVATFPADAHVARFVRIRLDGQNFLHLRTFQVFGRPVDQ